MAKTLICGQNQFNSKNAYVRANVAQIAKKFVCAQKQSKNGFMCAKVRQIAKKACVRAEVTQEQKRLYPRKSSTSSKKAYMRTSSC